MKLPLEYFEFYPDNEFAKEKWKFHSLKGLSEWIMKNKPEEIEMAEKQFWNFTWLQPQPLEERYWRTYHGIPLRCPEMTFEQQCNLGIWPIKFESFKIE